jgi:hypothetical protein
MNSRAFEDLDVKDVAESDWKCVNRGGTAGIFLSNLMFRPRQNSFLFRELFCRGLFFRTGSVGFPAESSPPEVCAPRTKGKEPL